MNDVMSFNRQSEFFAAGLRFQCRQCGACCTGEPGTIYVSNDDILHLTRHLQISRSELIGRFLYPFKDSYSIAEDEQGQCLFYDQGCTIYRVRPHQCRTFPFWMRNLRSSARWQDLQGHCPGIGSGRLYSRKEILTMARTTFHI